MPMNFAIDRAKEFTVFHLSGEVAYSEFVDTLQTYIEKQPTIYEVYDLRHLSGNRFSAEQIQALAMSLVKRVAKRPSGSKTAVVADKKIDYGISRMISMLTEQAVPYRIEVFRSMDEAYKWLDETLNQ